MHAAVSDNRKMETLLRRRDPKKRLVIEVFVNSVMFVINGTLPGLWAAAMPGLRLHDF